MSLNQISLDSILKHRGFRLKAVLRIVIRIQEGINYPQKFKKVKKISCFDVLDVLGIQLKCWILIQIQ
jgi:hypothetical protein